MPSCTLRTLKRGMHARVVGVRGDGALLSRLTALGLRPGETVTLLRVSPMRRTFLLQTEESVFALGREAAECVIAEV